MGKKRDFSVVILAAGLSERMGEPKMFLKWNKLSFIENIVEGYINFGCRDIIVVLNERDKLQFEMLNLSGKGIKSVVNYHVELGRFYSLKIGLTALSRIHHCFVNNVDNPFVELNVLTSMKNLVRDNNNVVPFSQGKKGHPVLISKEIIKNIIREKDFSLNLKKYLMDYDCVLCKVDSDNIHINVNTFEDYKRIIDDNKKYNLIS